MEQKTVLFHIIRTSMKSQVQKVDQFLNCVIQAKGPESQELYFPAGDLYTTWGFVYMFTERISFIFHQPD